MSINLCDCANDCPDHWTFLGASVVDFSVSAGLGINSSTLTVKLAVDDQCNSPRFRFDNGCDVIQYTGSDPGFFGETVDIHGVPVLFKFGEFEFGGIVQSWQKSESSSGEFYAVRVTSGTEILDGVQVILSEYDGLTNSVPNIINVYGYYEGGNSCPTFGSSRNFGKGVPWNLIKPAVSVLTSAFPAQTDFLQAGRIQYKAGLNLGYGVYPESTTGYILDLSEMPNGPDDYRISGASDSILNIINKVATDFGYDFYIETLMCKILGNPTKIFKVRMISRAVQPSLDNIKSFITDFPCGEIERSYGCELTTNPTNSMVIGPMKEQMYFVENGYGRETPNYSLTTQTFTTPSIPGIPGVPVSCQEISISGNNITTPKLSGNLIQPFWGLDPSGNAIVTKVENDGSYVFTGNFWNVQNNMRVLIIPAEIELQEDELRAAAAGYDSWRSYISSFGTSTQAALFGSDEPGVFDVRHLRSIIDADLGARGILVGYDVLALRSSKIDDEIEADIRSVFEHVNLLATEYYGKQYMVRIPFLCGNTDPDTGKVVFSREITDGGWNEDGGVEINPLIGIDTTSLAADFFRQGDGKLAPYVRYDDRDVLDLEGLEQDQYGYFDNVPASGSVWVKCEVSNDFVFGQLNAFADPRAVLRVPNQVRYGKYTSNVSQNLLGVDMSLGLSNGFPLDVVPTLPLCIADSLSGIFNNKVGGLTFTNPVEQKAASPSAATIALLNREEVYGPWVAGTPGIAGKSRVISDSSLAPWNLGGIAGMNTAGTLIAEAEVTNQCAAELGHVTIPGLPTARVGSELLSYAGSSYISGQYSVTTRTADLLSDNGNSYYVVPLLSGSGVWSGTLGPTIRDISMRIDNGGILTTYNLKTFTDGFGRREQFYADRLKRIGQLRQEFLNTVQRGFTNG